MMSLASLHCIKTDDTQTKTQTPVPQAFPVLDYSVPQASIMPPLVMYQGQPYGPCYQGPRGFRRGRGRGRGGRPRPLLKSYCSLSKVLFKVQGLCAPLYAASNWSQDQFTITFLYSLCT